jgi:hypothetical protein
VPKALILARTSVVNDLSSMKVTAYFEGLEGESLTIQGQANSDANNTRFSQAPAAHCTRKSPLPLLPSGPGGVGGKTSRGADA